MIIDTGKEGVVNVKVITEPSVHVIGRQAIDRAGLEQFLEDNGSPGWTTDAPSPGEALVEVAGRACYNSYVTPRPGGNSAYVGHILDVAHGSVLEHAVLTILIDGISRTLSHELVRHRQGIGVSQESQRYVDASDCAFVVPPLLMRPVAAIKLRHRVDGIVLAPGGGGSAVYGRVRDELMAADPCWLGVTGPQFEAMARIGADWKSAIRVAQEEYERLSDAATEHLVAHIHDRTARRKAAREAARSVLPGCAATRITLTLNARAARWLCELRGSLMADAEFARLAVVLCRTFQAEWPNLFADMTIEADDSGREYVACRHHKV